MPTIHLTIKGKVQGVFYRVSAKKEALMMNLKGWVMNTEEGQVVMKVTGPTDDLNTFVNWCRKGPSRAQVEDIIVTPIPEESFNDFIIQ